MRAALKEQLGRYHLLACLPSTAQPIPSRTSDERNALEQSWRLNNSPPPPPPCPQPPRPCLPTYVSTTTVHCQVCTVDAAAAVAFVFPPCKVYYMVVSLPTYLPTYQYLAIAAAAEVQQKQALLLLLPPPPPPWRFALM